MPFSKDQQRAALLESHNRHMRELGLHDRQLTDAGTPATREAMPYVPERMRQHSASVSCWERGLKGRTVGTAPGYEDNPAYAYTMRVTRNGRTTIESTRRRASGSKAPQASQTLQTSDCARLGTALGDSNH